MNANHLCLLLAALISAASANAAQPLPGSTDPKAAVPSMQYESAFSDYRPYREPPTAPWQDLNGEVARIGGHAGSMGSAPGDGSRGNELAEPAPVATEAGQVPARSAPKPPAGNAHKH